MIEDVFVIDSVVHGHDFRPENFREGANPETLIGLTYGFQKEYSPDPKWVMDEDKFRAGPDVDLMANALFAESQVDACIYHALPIYSLFKNGSSPIHIGREMKKRWPGRVAIYGALSPYMPDWRERLAQMVEEDGIVGVKFYPQDIVDGRLTGFRLDDEALMYPIFEEIQKLGIKTVAMHKAVPFGPVGIEDFRVEDVGQAADSFPNLNFEVFHAGLAFVEETIMQMLYAPNVTVNLEGTISFATKAPMKFGHIIGQFLAAGAADRITWGTGCVACHPQPFLEAFWNFEMPEALMEGYNYPPLTREIKRDMLGLTQARICGLDIEAMKAEAAKDSFAEAQAKRLAANEGQLTKDGVALAEPWSGGRK